MAELGIYSWIIACLLIYLPWHYGRVIAIIFPIMGMALSFDLPFSQADIFSYLFLFNLLAGAIFNFNRPGKFSSIMSYFSSGSALYLLNADLITSFVMLEFIGLSNLLLIWHNSNDKIYGLRYVVVHVFTGVCFLSGVMQEDPVNYMTLAALLINIGYLPFSGWIIEAYSSANPSANIFLFNIMTKANLYLLLDLFIGENTLPLLGAATMIYAVIYAIFSRNLKEILCYNLVQHLGMIAICIAFCGESEVIMIGANIFFSIIYIALTLILINLHENNHSHFSLLSKFYLLIAGLSASAFPASVSWLTEVDLVHHLPYPYQILVYASNVTISFYFLKLARRIMMLSGERSYSTNEYIILFILSLLLIIPIFIIPWPEVNIKIVGAEILAYSAMLLCWRGWKEKIIKLPPVGYNIGNLYLLPFKALHILINYLAESAQTLLQDSWKVINLILNHLTKSLWNLSIEEKNNSQRSTKLLLPILIMLIISGIFI